MKHNNSKTTEELMSLLFATRRLVRSRVALKGRGDPSTWLQIETLHCIQESRHASMGALAAYLNITAPSVSSLINGLVRARLVERHSATDRRSVLLVLTAKGKRELAHAIAARSRALRVVFSKLSTRDLHTLIRILRVLNRAHHSSVK